MSRLVVSSLPPASISETRARWHGSDGRVGGGRVRRLESKSGNGTLCLGSAMGGRDVAFRKVGVLERVVAGYVAQAQ